MIKTHWLTAQANRRYAARWLGGGVAVGALAMLVLAPERTQGASGAEKSAGKPVTFESIAGSKVKRIVLSEKAAQRLGIETGTIGEESIARTRIVGGAFTIQSALPPMQTSSAGGLGSFTLVRSDFAVQTVAAPVMQPSQTTLPARAADEGLVRVMFSPAEWEKVAKDQPARIYKLGTTGDQNLVLTARPSATPPLEDFKRSMLMYFYTVNGKDHGLTQNERVRVEVQLTNSGDRQKVVPYSAVYYDAKGDAWLYVNPKPFVYERQPIKVDRIIGDKAALSGGPDVGVAVVTIGAAMLYGTEIYGK